MRKAKWNRAAKRRKGVGLELVEKEQREGGGRGHLPHSAGGPFYTKCVHAWGREANSGCWKSGCPFGNIMPIYKVKSLRPRLRPSAGVKERLGFGLV